MAYGSKITQSVYYAGPSWVKNLMATLYGYRQRRLRYREYFYRQLNFLQRSQYWSNDELTAYQTAERDRFVINAVNHSPYYRIRDIYRKFPHESFENLPILPKQEIRDHVAEICADNLRSMKPIRVHTSGTTGSSLAFPVSRAMFEREYAYRALHNSWGGISLYQRDPIAFCAGHPVAYSGRTTPPFWVTDRSNNMLLLSSYHLDAKNMESYIRELERFQPAMLAGYPSSVYLLALAYDRYQRGRLTLRAIYTSSETLYDFQRSAIERAFGVKVFNYYGNTEGCANAMECERGEIHLMMDHSYVEILKQDNAPCKGGESGRMVCTAFGNDAFPLIRYDIGDSVVLSHRGSSECGRGGILLDRILGRNEDYIFTPDGRVVGRLDHIFKDASKVVEAQIFQKSIERITIRIVRSPGYGHGDEKEILAKARERLGPSLILEMEYLDAIPRALNGKMRFICSELDQASLLKNFYQSLLR